MDTSNIREKRMNSRQEYTKAKADFEELYANADDDTRAKIEGLMRSSLNYSSANPMNNRSAREYQTQIYKNAVDIMNGKITPATAGIVSTPNWFNGYSHEENQNNANYVTNRYLDGNNARQSRPSTSGASAPAGSGSFHRYNWAKGLDKGWTLDTDTFDDRMSNFARILASNLREAQDASKSGKKLIGISDNEISEALAFLGQQNWNKDNFKTLMNAAQKAGVDPQWFMDYFDGLVPGSDPVSKNKAERTKTGYLDVDLSTLSENIKKALGTNRLMKHKDTGEYKLFGSDYSDYTGNAFDWVDLNQGDTYGNGIVVDNTGRAFLGDIRTIKDEGNAYKDLYDAVMERRKNYNQAFMRKKFNLDNDYSENNLINEFVKQRSTARPDIKDISYTDVSRMFGGNNLVLAYNDDGTELGEGDFGELVLNPNTRFVWQDAEGKLHYGNFEEAKIGNGEFRHGGFDNEETDQAGLLYDTSDLFKGVEGISGDTNLVSRNWKRVLEAGTVGAGVGAAAGVWAGPGALIGALGGFATGAVVDLITQYYNNDTIANKPQAFVDSAIQALKDPNKKIKVQGVDMTGSEFLAQFGSREQLLATIGAFMQSKQVTLSPEDKKMIRNLYLDLSEDAQGRLRAHKLGGILLAADGYKVYAQEPRNRNNWHEKYDKTQALKKEDADIAKAQQEGYKSAEHYRANKNTNHLSTADMMRIGTIAADVTSIIASFTSATGAGAAVAEGAGLAAFGIDTAADIIDPSVSSGEVLKNGLINAGLASISFIPGARIPKTLAKITKYAPKVLLAASAMGIAMDESVQNTFKKVTEGKEKLNTEDWRNIAHIFTLVAAGSRTGRQGYEKFRVKKDLKGTSKNMLDVKQGDIRIGEIPVDKKSELASIEKLAKEGKLDGKDGAIEKLAALLNKTPNEVKGFFSENNKVIGVVKGKNSLDLKTSEQKTDVDIDKALKAFEDAKYSGNSNWTWLRNAPTWRQRGIMSVTDIYPARIVGNRGTEGVVEEMQSRSNKYQQQRQQIQKLDQARFNAEVQRNNASEIRLNNSSNLRNISRNTLKEAKDIVAATGVKINNSGNFKQFLIELRLNNPRYRQALKNKRFVQLSKEQYNFKDGGKVNYQKLRK